MSRGDLVKNVSVKVDDSKDQLKITYTVEKQEEETLDLYRDVIRSIEHNVVSIISEKVADQLFNDILSKMDANAIANATTVQIIKDMSNKDGRNNY